MNFQYFWNFLITAINLHGWIIQSNEMISFDYRILSEYKIKTAKIETLANSILKHKDPKGEESKDASEFLILSLIQLKDNQ